MENTNLNVVSEQGVVDSADVSVETSLASAAQEAEQSANSAEAVAKPRQDAETNAAFAALRREKERLEAELKESHSKADRLVKSLRTDGYNGENMDDLTDELDANRANISVSELRSRRDAEAKRISEMVQKDPSYIQAQEDAKRYRELVHKNVMQQDLAEINAAYPDAKLKDLEELGDQFAKLRANGISNLVAYNAVKGSKQTAETTVPPVPGEVNAGAGEGEKEFYTPEDVDRLKPEEITDAVMKRIRDSMKKWKR